MGAGEHGVQGVVTACLQASGAAWRTVAAGEWGLIAPDVGGRPLEVGLRLHDGLLGVQCWVAPAGALDPHLLLHRNRLGALARYTHSSAGDVHVQAEAFLSGLTVEAVDRLLSAVVEAAEWARAAEASRTDGRGDASAMRRQ
jgi:hypothetical protein